tara:strand:+ start:120700 stop:120906 length:207 start_codon:yes stop_codon:yes gene_type:complete
MNNSAIKKKYDNSNLTLVAYWREDLIGEFEHLESVNKYYFEPNENYKKWSEDTLTAILETLNGLNGKN